MIFPNISEWSTHPRDLPRLPPSAEFLARIASQRGELGALAREIEELAILWLIERGVRMVAWGSPYVVR
jgi:hypothetical protein